MAPGKNHTIGIIITQATRQIGSVVGVTITIILLTRANLQYTDFKSVYLFHIAMALITALLVNTKTK